MFHIFLNVILPVFIMLGCGFALQRAFGIDVRSLSKINFYILVPALIFVKFSQADIGLGGIGQVMGFTGCMILSMFLIAWIVAALRGHSSRLRAAFAASAMFYNSGNYGLPVIEMLYHSPIATGVQTIVIATQNLFNFTLGLFVVSSGAHGIRGWAALAQMARYPFLYALALAFAVRTLHISVPAPIWVPLSQFSGALVPIALLTLGAQLATVKVHKGMLDVLLSSAIRLIGGPLIAPLWLWAWNISGFSAEVLSITVAVPTAVNTVIMAIELDNEPEFASQAVCFSTLASAITMTAVIYLARA